MYPCSETKPLSDNKVELYRQQLGYTQNGLLTEWHSTSLRDHHNLNTCIVKSRRIHTNAFNITYMSSKYLVLITPSLCTISHLGNMLLEFPYEKRPVCNIIIVTGAWNSGTGPLPTFRSNALPDLVKGALRWSASVQHF